MRFKHIVRIKTYRTTKKSDGRKNYNQKKKREIEKEEDGSNKERQTTKKIIGNE